MKRIIPFLFLLLALSTAEQSLAQMFIARGKTYRNPEAIWVDSVMQTLTLEQRIAQLMIVRVPLDMTDRQAKAFSETMNGYGVGGVCFFAGTAERQVAATKLLQREAAVPLFVCVDGEWGLGMRLKDAFSFPRNARFGQLTPDADSIVYRMGREIGCQCREMGIHINFAPVVDINSNPRNPVIGTRSFGIDRERVSRLGIMYALGQQSQGVIATAKHFPGHGDTEADSHYELPVIRHSRAYIDSIDTYPFRRLIEAGVEGIMVAHLRVDALDSLRPSSLSPAVVSGLLRGEMGFDGLVVTDGLDMKGVTNSYAGGRGELAALLAGNDLLLLPPDVPQAVEAIKVAAELSDSVRTLIDYHCRRVLRSKFHHVVPTITVAPRVPAAVNRECNAIVSDLNLNIDRRIDSVVNNALDAHAMPGCQVAVMHGGRLVVDRCYGRHTYDSASSAVTPETLYDVASLTKVCATTLAVMKLYDEGRLRLDDRMSKYLPYLRHTDKERLTIRQALSHCAGLKAYDALWKRSSNRDTILSLITQSKLGTVGAYCYSDFGFMLLADIVDTLAGESLENYVSRQFYIPMGLEHTLFRPAEHGIPMADIAPTEIDSLRGEIRGSVHDPNAYAMEQGSRGSAAHSVTGHAGLFSTARDVACLMQMLLNGGVYRGHRYLEAKTVELFTSRHYAKQGNRRALGFDKQLFTPSANAQVCPEASQASFGHTGFTGTMLWVDPDYDLVYVFLSNRVHPAATPNRLAQMNTRTDIQSLLYGDIIN